MDRKGLVQSVTDKLRDCGLRKSSRKVRQTFHVSDDEGNTRDFTVEVPGKKTVYTQEDVDNILVALKEVLCDILRVNDVLRIQGIGKFELRLRPSRPVLLPDGRRTMSKDRYIPVFKPGSDFYLAGRIYQMNLEEGSVDRKLYDEEITNPDIDGGD